MTFEPNKFYRIKAGDKAIVYAVYEREMHGAVFIADEWCIVVWDRNGKPTGSQYNWDLVGPWVEPLDFDWSCLPKWADRFIAMDEHKHRWCAYSNKPIQFEAIWIEQSRESTLWLVIPVNYAPKNYTGDWKDSLRMNPKYEEKK